MWPKWPVPHDGRVGHAELGQRPALECVRLEPRGVRRVVHHVDQRRGEVLGGLEPLIERGRAADLLHQLRGDRLAGLVVDQVPIDDGVGQEPSLEQL